jgi:hypothetical protein
VSAVPNALKSADTRPYVPELAIFDHVVGFGLATLLIGLSVAPDIVTYRSSVSSDTQEGAQHEHYQANKNTPSAFVKLHFDPFGFVFH